MSGPKIVIVVAPEPVTIMTSLVAASAIQAAMAIAESTQEAQRLATDQAALRAEEQLAQADAERSGFNTMQAEADASATRVAQLGELAAKLGLDHSALAGIPRPPATNSPAVLASYVRHMQQLVAELQDILLRHAALHRDDATEVTEMIIPESVAAGAYRTTAQRLLARAGQTDDLPADLTRLAAELDATLPGERADLLANELRQQVQQHLAAAEQAALQRATTTIVEQSLKDLGYQVEAIAETLFVEGGIVHFQRRDWGDYQVRLRVAPGGNSINFNVVRAVDAGNNERSVLDHIAEDRWCAEFPALLRALEARGLRLQVTRHLQAGELPVQLVDRSKLPNFADRESHAPTRALNAMRKENS